MKRRLLIAAATLLYLISAGQSFAQTSNATLGGTVSDATGALIPGVSITATNIATGIVNMTVSNEAGAYQFASLQTGAYRITAELSGFQTQAYNDVTLGISQQVRLNFTLQVGTVAQAVEVTVASDTAIATTSAFSRNRAVRIQSARPAVRRPQRHGSARHDGGRRPNRRDA